ncbi:carboxypeptidase regulatory-like domain-containing protein [Roseisolibacter sp. H3M3-2]|uniref:carboxypeptidase regulatory-like domain-containing protein n=1 Tax=Roseisolibacter sp. H3M3-2 TaxID=3031323 RepID=UPI0023DCE122|nr:carboxypeptidase regulatory-like domain-containing protein [Roseisolibacter sp. H3M3-2]MDF1501411.1 carboxypeptidase regulatory-like domain-containing protein [Roseisolibacter sp. H3M3-2]
MRDRPGARRARSVAAAGAPLAAQGAVARAATAQGATVAGAVVAHEGGEPLGYTTVAVPALGVRTLAREEGTFVLRGLPPGEVRLRFTRIGYAPRDTTLAVAADGTARVRVALARLVLRLPTRVVNGACTDRTPFEPRPADLAQLFDQVEQGADRTRLLAAERPFVMQATRTRGRRDRGGALATDTITRGPLPANRYVPRRIYGRAGEVWAVKLPELADVADTAFTNHHCLWYAGQQRFGGDSVIRVDFEPVPWLAREVDLEGSIYVRAADFRLVGMETRLNRIPPEFRGLRGYATRARFDELGAGVPVLAEWELTNTFRDADGPVVVETGRVTGVRWLPRP